MEARQLERSFPARASALAEIRRFLRDRVTEAAVPAEVAEDVTLAVSEACNNSVLHTPSDHLEVRVSVLPNRVEVQVEVQGTFAPDSWWGVRRPD